MSTTSKAAAKNLSGVLWYPYLYSYNNICLYFQHAPHLAKWKILLNITLPWNLAIFYNSNLFLLIFTATSKINMLNNLFMFFLYASKSFLLKQISGVHWWYKTASHAAELVAGFYNPCNRDGYASIASVLKKHGAMLNFTCVELHTLNQQQDISEALADPEGLIWQVIKKKCLFDFLK